MTTTTDIRDIRLIENFIQSEEEERILLSNVHTNGEESEEEGGYEELLKKEQGKEGRLKSSFSSWKVLSGRRVKTFGGTVNAQKTIGERLPNFLKDLCLRIEMDERVKETFSLSSSSSSSSLQQQQLLRLNHVLVNEYQPNEGISSHQDGPLYASFVCVVSLARDEIVSFTPHEDFKDALKPFDVFVPRRSLLVFYGKSYDCYLHGIRGGEGGRRSKREGDNDDEMKRISLTFRHVKNSLIPGKALSGALFGKR